MTSATMKLLKEKKGEKVTSDSSKPKEDTMGKEALEEQLEETTDYKVLTEDDEGNLIVPDASEVGTMDTKTVTGLYQDLVGDELIDEVEGFSKKTLKKKRDLLAEAIKGLEEEIDADEEASDEPEEAEETEQVDEVEQVEEAEEAPEEEKKPAKKTPAKTTKTVAKGEVLAPNQISSFSKEVENITDSDKIESMIAQLIDQNEFNLFKVGGCLAVAQSNPDWWGGEHDSFGDYVLDTFGMKYRKAMYLIEIYNGMVTLDLPWEQVKNLGWSKLTKVLPLMIENPDTVDTWVNKAGDMSVLQLEQEIKASKTALSNGEEMGDSATTEKVTTKTFKVHEDQKETINEALAKAKEEANTDVDTVALDLICMSYLGGNTKNVTMKQFYSKALKDADGDVATALTALLGDEFEEIFPNVTLEVSIDQD